MFKEILIHYPHQVFCLIALYQAYKGLKDMSNCKKTREKILNTLANNKHSKLMYDRHRDLLKETDFFNLH